MKKTGLKSHHKEIYPESFSKSLHTPPISTDDISINSAEKHGNISRIKLSQSLLYLLATATICLISLMPSSAATKTWTGSTNSDWATGSNWGGTAPATGDDALIPGGLVNYPLITGSVTIKTININNTGSGASVSVSGGSLTVTSLLTVSANGTFNMTSGTATFTGGVTSAGTFNMQGGTAVSPNNFTVSGTLAQSGGLIWLATNTSTNPTHNLVLSNGMVNQSGGTFYTKDYAPTNGTFNQTGSGAIFRIFRDWKPSSGHTFNATDGTVQFSGAGSSDFTSPNTQLNHVIVDADPKFANTNNSTVRIRGNFTNNVGANLNLSNSLQFIFNGTSSQQITSTSFQTFSNLQIANTSAAVSFASNIIMTGALTINSGGTLNVSSYNLSSPTSVLMYCGSSAGSIISGTGSLQLAGNITISSSGTGTQGALISSNVSLGAARTITVADDGTGAVDMNISGIISGAFAITKSGPGSMVLSGSNTYSGTTTINAGQLILGSTGTINDGSNFIFTGGSLKTELASNQNEVVGTLNVSNACTISLGSNPHVLSFAASSGSSWTAGEFVVITDWAGGYDGTAGTAGKIKVGTTSGGLTQSQLNQVCFFNGSSYFAATILSDGEVVPLSTTCAPRNFSYTSQHSLIRNSAITPISPAVTGYVASYSISPTLHTGLSFNTSTGVISGTPSVNATPVVYTITATNACGSATYSVSIEVGYKSWTGAVNTDWSNASNWHGGIPGTTDDVLIPGSITNYPVLATTTTVKTININYAGNGGTLTVATGGNLTLSGAGADYTIVSAGGTLIQTGGTITFNSKKPTIAGTFQQSGGTMLTDQTITATGNINQSGGLIHLAVNTSTNPNIDLVLTGATIQQTGGTIYVRDWNHTSGNYSQSGSGAILRIFRDWKPTSGHTFISTAGAVKFSGVGNGNFTSPNSQFYSLIIDADPKFGNTNNSTVRISGNFSNNISGSLNVTGSTLFLFNGSGAQTITGSSNITFSNVEVTNTTGIVSLASNITMNGTLTVRAGANFNLQGYNLVSPTGIIMECGATATATISGTGELQPSGNLTINNAGTGNMGAAISCNILLSANRTFTVGNDGTDSIDLTVTGTISGAFGIIKDGVGSMALSGTNTFSGATNVTAGKLMPGAVNAFSTNSVLTLNGGTLQSGLYNGYNENLGTLALNSTSTIHLAAGVHTFNFAASSSTTWSSTSWILVTGWTGGYNGTSGTGGKLVFGNSTGGLSAQQVGQICFFNGSSYFGATILPDGEVVPLAVSFAPRNLSYPAQISLSRGDNMTPASPTVTGFVQSYSISPALFNGMSFNTTTGIISGSCNNFNPPTTFTITASNWNGSTTFTISIEVGKTWSGTVNTDWRNAANWHGAVPSTGEEVRIPGGLVNYPVISDTVNLKSVAINTSSTGASLTVANGGVLVMTGAPDDFELVEPTGTLYQTGGSITALSKKARIHGAFVQSGGTYQSDKDIVVYGTITQTGGLINMTINTEADPTDKLDIIGGTVTQSGGSIYVKDYKSGSGYFYQTGPTALLRIYKAWKPGTDHIFHATAGTVEFTGNPGGGGDFRSTNVQFHHVLVTVDPRFGNQNNSIIKIGGNYTNNHNADLDVNNSTLFHFNGVAAQSITSAPYLAMSNVRVSNPISSVSLASNVIMNGTLTVNAAAKLNLSTFNMGTPTSVTLECGAANGSQINGSGYLTLGGNITVNNIATGTNGALISGNLILGANRSFIVADDGTSAYDLTVSGLISASNFLLTKSGAGTLGFQNASLALHSLTISAGFLASTPGTLSLTGHLTNNATFAHNDGTVVLNGSASQTISGTSAINFYNLTLNNSLASIPQIVFSRNIAAEKMLTMTTGVVNLSGNTFTLGTNGGTSTLLRTASTTTNWMYGGTFKRFWVNGTSITSNSANYYGLFPVGTSSASTYRPVEMNSQGTITTSGFFTVNHVHSNTVINMSPMPDDNGVPIMRLHGAQFITGISGVTAANLSMGITMTGLNGGSLQDIRLAIFSGGTTGALTGTHLDAIGTVQSPTAFRTGITNLASLNNDFRIATTNNFTTPLPVKTTSFYSKCESGTSTVYWTTQSEVNNDYFTIERSLNGEEWELAGYFKGSGNSTVTNHYRFLDNEAPKEVFMYRLFQTDFDGTTQWCGSSKAGRCKNTEIEMLVYPNPSQGSTFVTYTGDEKRVINMQVQNSLGDVVYEENGFQEQLNLEELPSGIYHVKITADHGSIMQKVIIRN